MKKGMTILSLVLLVMLVLGGCSGNLFMQWESVPEFNASATPSNDSEVSTYLDSLYKNLSVDRLSENDIDDTKTTLSTIYNDPVTYDESSVEAASIYSGYLSISQDENAQQVINNVTGNVTDIMTKIGDGDVNGVIEVIAGDVLSDSVTFTNTINSLLEAADAYTVLSGFVADGVIAIEDPDGTIGEPEDIAFNAAISLVIQETLSIIDADGTLGNNDGTIDQAEIDNFYGILTGSVTFDLSTADPTSGLTDDTDTTIYPILQWAGLETLFVQ